MANIHTHSAEGQAGSIFCNGTSPAITPPSGTVFVAIQMLENTTFDSTGGLVATDSDKYVNTEAASSAGGGAGGDTIAATDVFLAGSVIYGRWTEIDLAGGSIIAYIGA